MLKPPTPSGDGGFVGAPDRIRTCGLLIRSQTLYPAELRAPTGGGGGIRTLARARALLQV